MDEKDREKLERIIDDRKKAHQYLVSKGSRVYRTFLDLEKEAFSSGNLEKKYKELVALGISIVINCESCIEWHTAQALKAGASEEQVLEAIEVGIEMGGGPATVSSRFALKALEYHGGKK
ncbi:MAG: carboxymuconolactone decarboxylase family protein [Candidatus Abyssobacteria bacterium SURF_5]|uniref:Carboxymuconolactone decarboxylase family protein n=1 Tax=Abyssobacteria bacterium (strain SURF_5) TaxID=2093360 RepID=A0A3A4NP54_ABYX5|nr:MAG: carboxymuconolactone decarboxylase family protein [Candidatus Abyssubacteria bacterium SURF_5]